LKILSRTFVSATPPSSEAPCPSKRGEDVVHEFVFSCHL